MKAPRLILRGFFALLFVLLSCNIGSSGFKCPNKFEFVEIEYVAGDDGTHHATLNIYRKGNSYHAKETTWNNYGPGENRDTFYKADLTAEQLRKVLDFACAIANLSSDCPKTSSRAEYTRVLLDGKTKEIEGNCEWGNNSYFDLRKTIFRD